MFHPITDCACQDTNPRMVPRQARVCPYGGMLLGLVFGASCAGIAAVLGVF